MTSPTHLKSTSPTTSLNTMPSVEEAPSMSAGTSTIGAGNSMPQTPDNGDMVDIKENENPMRIEEEEEDDTNDLLSKHAQLRTLLEKSSVYAQLIGDRMRRQRAQKAQQEERAAHKQENAKSKAASVQANGRRTAARLAAKKEDIKEEIKVTPTAIKRKRDIRSKVKAEQVEIGLEDEAIALAAVAAAADDTAGGDNEREKEGKIYIGEQPALITGATLRDYQLAGVQWMVSLYENGLNGILADEMGLGKTLQTISFLAYLCEKGTTGPFLIVCPLSVLANWITEFQKFAPDIPVLMYHGSPDERQRLRTEEMRLSDAHSLPKMSKGRSGVTAEKPTIAFPVIVTTYEMVTRDQKYLSKYMWKYIVVDEGHRLKNFDCLLLRQLKTYTSANRLILTGTPLHNNLAELWSLLNFILPNIFDNLESFQKWFDLDEISHGVTGQSRILERTSVVSSLHDILKPFLLRRLKEDVEPDLPPKKEYVLYAPLTQQQKDLSDAVARGGIRQYLINMKGGVEESSTPSVSEPDSSKSENEEETRSSRRLKKKPRLSYKIELNDDKFIDDLENGRTQSEWKPEETAEEVGKDWAVRSATKQVNNMKLQNVVMQLRKVANHPFLFDWPVDPTTGMKVVNEDLVNASGKVLLLQRLLDALLARGHRVLIFSQFTTMLDVIEDWAVEFKQINLCRIDGSTSQADRLSQMNDFNNSTRPDAPNVFLLSTRAGGLGINLVSADTVIFFDQDWNPQQDLQAAARAHRIGQKKPVLIFRLVTDGTIETHILKKAANKRKLEALVISQGKFGKIVNEKGEVLLDKKSSRAETAAEMAKTILELDHEGIRVVNKDDNIIADDDLEALLDRSPEAFARAPGWNTTVDKKAKTAAATKAAFEVFVTAEDEDNETLAKMFTE